MSDSPWPPPKQPAGAPPMPVMAPASAPPSTRSLDRPSGFDGGGPGGGGSGGTGGTIPNVIIAFSGTLYYVTLDGVIGSPV